MEFLGKSVQCIEISDEVESVIMQNCQVVFLTALRVDHQEILRNFYVHCIEDCCGGWWKYFGMRNWKY